MANQTSGNKHLGSTNTDVMMAFKSMIMNELNVAELCQVERQDSVDEYRYRCKMINNSNTIFEAIRVKNLKINVGDIVIVVFCNSDFRTNLKRKEKNQQFQNENNIYKHSLNYGIIVGCLGKDDPIKDEEGDDTNE